MDAVSPLGTAGRWAPNGCFFLARDTDKSESGKQLKMARRKSHNLEVESEPVNKGKAADGAGCFFVRMPKSSSALAGATK